MPIPASKRSSARLGAVRSALLPTGAWQRWARQRLARTGGTLEQYKHPCLIPDPGFRDGLPVEQELGVNGVDGLRVDAAGSVGRTRHLPVTSPPVKTG